MRYFNLILFTLLLTIAACGDKEDLPNAKVIKDCNGTFIQIESTYYQVCNEDILSSVPNLPRSKPDNLYFPDETKVAVVN